MKKVCTPVLIGLYEDQRQALQLTAEEQGLSRAAVIRQLIVKYLIPKEGAS